MKRAAVAHPNIALVKYWGKSDVGSNLPAVGSISITLDSLTTTTRVDFDRALERDELELDGRPATEARAERVRFCLDLFRRHRPDLPPAMVTSENSFPTAAGLASSASGFAALVTAVNAALDDPLETSALAEISRRCSGSSPRSLFGGYVELALAGDGTEVRPLLDREMWPLEVVIAVTSTTAKKVGSTEGMELTRTTSPYYDSWVERSPEDLSLAREAIATRDFDALAVVSEASCLAMHAVAMAARPGLVYWNGATVEAMGCVRELRGHGAPVFFTIDAGPQLKAICDPQSADRVADELAAIPGVVEILRCGLGDGARVVNE
jgi:diphosphomevalonate decarboxylase